MILADTERNSWAGVARFQDRTSLPSQSGLPTHAIKKQESN